MITAAFDAKAVRCNSLFKKGVLQYRVIFFIWKKKLTTRNIYCTSGYLLRNALLFVKQTNFKGWTMWTINYRDRLRGWGSYELTADCHISFDMRCSSYFSRFRLWIAHPCFSTKESFEQHLLLTLSWLLTVVLLKPLQVYVMFRDICNRTKIY